MVINLPHVKSEKYGTCGDRTDKVNNGSERNMMKKVHGDKYIVEKDIEDTESKIGDYDAAAKTLSSLRQGQSDKENGVHVLVRSVSPEKHMFTGHRIASLQPLLKKKLLYSTPDAPW